MNLILAIDTSCDETSAAVTCRRRVLSNVISSQVDLHKKYGGVYPALAKRAHQERIDFVVKEALRRAKRQINVVAVTQGPGLAIALEVGIKKAKEISTAYSLPLIAINHLEGHIYSCLAENLNGLPKREILFPSLCLIVSGGHTSLVLMKDHGLYKIIGETLDDACGEALDKAAKILHLGYPGGPIIEILASKGEARLQTPERPPANDLQCRAGSNGGQALRSYILSQPMKDKTNLNFSYSGLKTQFLYLVQSLPKKEFSQNLTTLAYTFQEACFEQVIRKTTAAIRQYRPQMLVCGGGVIANNTLRKYLRQTANSQHIPILFPQKRNLITDNAAMIGIAAYYKYQRKEFVEDSKALEREPRLPLSN